MSKEFTKEREKALAAYRKMEQSSAFKRIAAYVIIAPNKNDFGRIRMLYPVDGMGALKVFVWDCAGDNGIQMGTASGCGYNKLDAAMNGIISDGLELGLDWGKQLHNAGYTIIQAV